MDWNDNIVKSFSGPVDSKDAYEAVKCLLFWLAVMSFSGGEDTLLFLKVFTFLTIQ